MKSSPLIEVKNLGVYRDASILQNIDWTVKPGEHWAVLGPNGSGKSSLLNALCAYLTPSSGEIRLLGKRYGRSDWRELRKKIGLVSSSLRPMIREDETALKAVISGRQAMLNYWGKVSDADRGKALRILKEVECAPLGDRPWGVLSQGEQQRVMIGRALMANYRILFLDEPCAGLDLVARERFLNFMQRLTRGLKNRTLVFVTHHVEEILPAFSHVLLLSQGRVVASGRKAKVLTAACLSKAYQAPIRIFKKGPRYAATVRVDKKFIL